MTSRAAFWTACAVLALCLWSSGAPSVLYPVYSAAWQLAPVVITAIFGAYPVALLATLLLFGGLSDAIGRRRTMLVGVALIALSGIVFALAPNVGWLFAGRVLQGIGAGFAMGAASASLVENNPTANPRLPGSLATVSTSAGLSLCLAITGLLAQHAPLPLSLAYVVLFVLSAICCVALWRLADDAPASQARFRPRLPVLAPGLGRVFATAALAVSAAYSVGAIFLSLGAIMARELSGTTDLGVVGLLLAVSSATIGVTGLLLGRIPPHLAAGIGGLVSVASIGVMLLVTATGSLLLFFAWCIVGGVGYSFAFTGGLGLVARSAPAAHRGATMSLVYLVAYLLQALTALGAGALATSTGLALAVDIAAPVLAALCVVVVVLATLDGHRPRPLGS